MSPARRNDVLMVSTAVALITVDQLSKRWIEQHLIVEQDHISLLGNIFELFYVQNRGVAFSLFDGQAVLFLLIGVALLVIGWLYWRLRDSGSLLLKLTFGLILGGAIGNLIDRFTHHYVVDFFHFHIPGVFEFAIFNVADTGITIGVALLALLLWRGEPHQASPEAAGVEPRVGMSRSARPSQQPGNGASASHSSLARQSVHTAPRIRHRMVGNR